MSKLRLAILASACPYGGRCPPRVDRAPANATSSVGIADVEVVERWIARGALRN